MGQISRWAYSLAYAGIIVVVLWVGLLAWGSWRQGFDWDEMDWNKDGSTSISEFLKSADVGKRPISKNDVDCMEYYSLKDGMPIKIVCPTESS